MTLEWTTQTLAADAGEQTLHALRSPGGNEDAVKDALEAALEKAVSLLDKNVQNDSRYLLCGWDAASTTLTIVVSDESKQNDAGQVVQCQLASLDASVDLELVQFLIRDYLTTCTAFLGWSLLAAFHEGDRQRSRLL